MSRNVNGGIRQSGQAHAVGVRDQLVRPIRHEYARQTKLRSGASFIDRLARSRNIFPYLFWSSRLAQLMNESRLGSGARPRTGELDARATCWSTKSACLHSDLVDPSFGYADARNDPCVATAFHALPRVSANIGSTFGTFEPTIKLLLLQFWPHP